MEKYSVKHSLAARIARWAEQEGKIGVEHAGFREDFSTSDNLLVIRSLVERERKKEKGRLNAGFVDFEKAFDSIDRNKLWDKLKKNRNVRKDFKSVERII